MVAVSYWMGHHSTYLTTAKVWFINLPLQPPSSYIFQNEIWILQSTTSR